MKSFQLPYLGPKYPSEEYLLDRSKETFKGFYNLSIQLIEMADSLFCQ